MDRVNRRMGWRQATLAAAAALLAGSAFLAGGCRSNVEPGSYAAAEVARELPVLGHRNWIVIADSAYPCQTKEGIATVATDEDQISLLRAVLAEIDHSHNVRPVIYLDSELPHVPEADAPGISAYRARLADALRGRPVESAPHEKTIERLNKAGDEFRVIILKSNLALPYTSVFLELRAGYWTDADEARLRKTMESAPQSPDTRPAVEGRSADATTK